MKIRKVILPIICLLTATLVGCNKSTTSEDSSSIDSSSVPSFTVGEKFIDIEATNPQVKNVIFMIPDGGGFGNFDLANEVKKAGGLKASTQAGGGVQVSASELYMKDYLVGNTTTNSTSKSATDSAASATAMATGYKTVNGYIGIDADKKPHATVLEAAQLLGKSTGLVTTIRWTHATPAGFSTHAESRNNGFEIGQQIFNQDIDVVLGTSFSKSLSGKDEQDAIDNGYRLVTTKEDLLTIQPGERIWGTVASEIPLDYELKETQPNLPEMVSGALRSLPSNENGFFLMVEGSYIDTEASSNDALGMVSEYIAFDEAFKVAVEFAKTRTDTAVIAMPDHDTGALQVPTGENLVTAVEQIRDGIKPELNWQTGGNHSTQNVGVFMYLPENVTQLEGLSPMNEKGDNDVNRGETRVIDNTDAAKFVASLFGVSLDEATTKLFVDITDQGTYDKDTRVFTYKDGKRKMQSLNSHYTIVNDDGSETIVKTRGQVSVFLNKRFYVPQIALD